MSFHWTCPFCQRDTTITDGHEVKTSQFWKDNADGNRVVFLNQIICPSEKCRKFTLIAQMYELKGLTGNWSRGPLIKQWNLIPASFAKILADYVPVAVKADYEEACAIRDLSPKASATLARRALQGMIRDFWKISRPRLIEEIEAIEDKVDPLTWKAIDAVRSVGNIGAHMEKDIDVIIDVDPDEAGLLIGLIETLVDDWYVERHAREERMNAVIELGEAKKAAKAATQSAQASAKSND